MRKLTDAEIEALASRKDVKRVAVENFLRSMPLHVGAFGTNWNMHSDAASYGWNEATQRAIRDGIDLSDGMRARP